ncbi:MAG: FtsQ-type POTRA domain-containing protein [Cellulomonadaceae bacterium]|jgi:cell division protein FtsQ|nr:FtsQ-type POTRA domain-containing protein [Cellulomonadaceae bacterium]
MRPTVSTAMAQRLAEKKAMRRRLWVKRILGSILAVAVVGSATWLFFFSPVFALDAEAVTAQGHGSTISKKAVNATVRSRIATPLPRVDVSAMEREILDLVGVKDVTVTRAWPTGLTINLTAREPVIAVPGEGEWTLVDGEGVIAGVRDERPEGLPLADVSLEDADLAVRRAVIEVLNALPDSLREDTKITTAESRDAVESVLYSGRVIRWGNERRMPIKTAVVLSMLSLEHQPRFIDVTSPELPISR